MLMIIIKHTYRRYLEDINDNVVTSSHMHILAFQ